MALLSLLLAVMHQGVAPGPLYYPSLHDGTLKHTEPPYWFRMMVHRSIQELKYLC